MSPTQPAISQWGWGFHTVRGGIDPGDLCFRLPLVTIVDVWKYFRSGDGNYPPRVRRDLGVGPRGNSRRALAPRAPDNQQSARGVRVSTPCGRYEPGGSPGLVPGLSEL